MIKMRNTLLCTFLILAFFVANSVFAQEHPEGGPSTADLIILFAVSILFVVGVIIYMAREVIMRRKTDYDDGSFDSKKDRDYEKYHSDWGDEATGAEKQRARKIDDGFEEQIGDSGQQLPDYYKVLGLERDATRDEIKKQYRKMAKEIHPDRTGDASAQGEMAEINEAYEVLSDEEKKERYDKFLGAS